MYRLMNVKVTLVSMVELVKTQSILTPVTVLLGSMETHVKEISIYVL